MSYALNQSPFYRIQSRRRLARDLLGLPLPKLEQLCNQSDNYRSVIRVTGGKQRQIDVAKPLLQVVHTRVSELLNRLELPPYLHSGRAGRSHVTNALVHLGAQRLAKLDIRHFFPSVTRERVWDFFATALQCSQDCAAILARLCTHRGSLPIGSSVSLVLAFHVVRPLLDELHCLAVERDLRFSCYVDDLTFSGPDADEEFLDVAIACVRKHGYLPHSGRCYALDEERLVTGVLLASDGAHVPAQHLARIEQVRQVVAQMEDLEARLIATEQLMGRLAAAAAIDASLLTQLNALTRERRRLLWRARPAPRSVKRDGKPHLHPRGLSA